MNIDILALFPEMFEGPFNSGTVKRAIERGDTTALSAEHDRLLGTGAKAGALGSMLKFDYGPDSTGNKRLGPLAISAPPGGLQPRK